MTEGHRKPNTICVVCDKAIYRRPGVLKQNKGNVYCNQSCYGRACRKEIPCLVCGTLLLSGLNKKTCSRSCANKNRTGISYNTGRLKDKVQSQKRLKVRLLKTRGKQCERCGFDVYQILQVHHIDRNRKHNELCNLELLCPNCHTEEHYLKKSKF